MIQPVQPGLMTKPAMSDELGGEKLVQLPGPEFGFQFCYNQG